MSLWWEESGLNFSCTGCGRCCGGEPGDIWVTQEERKKISEELQMDEIAFRQQCLRRIDGRCSIKEKENYDCLFLDAEARRCKIYKVRPLQCRLFPFWPSMLTDKRIWDYYAAFCPGMGSGRHYAPELVMKFLKLPAAAEL